MITIVCWKWEAAPTYRSKFTSDHVAILAAMIKRNATVPYRLVCVTDRVESIRGIPGVEPVQLWDVPKIALPADKPNCYRRLKLFDKDLDRSIFGDRVLSIDLDCVIVSNIDHILSESADFCGWTMYGMPFNGSLWSLKVGSRPWVWDDFDGVVSRNRAANAGFIGSDQAWMSFSLCHSEARYTPDKHGVYSWKKHIRKSGLPANASIVFFHGVPDPWDPALKEIPEAQFIYEHYKA